MKRIIIPLLGLAAFTLTAAAQTSDLLSQAQRAYVAGDYAMAKPLFQKVLLTDPQNVTARNFLKAMAVAESQAAPGAATEKQLRNLIIPKVDFANATFDSALDALRQQATKVSGGKVQTSFVVQKGVDVSTPVTLHLSNIPFTEVLRYLGELAKADFVVDRYAINVRPKVGDTVTNASQAAKSSAAPSPAAP